MAVVFASGRSAVASCLVVTAGVAHADDADKDRMQAALAQQIASCWTPPPDFPVVAPILRTQLNEDGSVKDVVIANHSQDPAFKPHAESARRAILRCAPFDMKAFAGRYEDWRELTVNFSMSDGFAPPKWQNRTAGVTTLMPSFQHNGKPASAIAVQSTSWDNRDVMVLFTCFPENKPDGVAIGIDFGVGRDQTRPQTVTMMYGETTDTRDYLRIAEYLGFEGRDAAQHIARLADASGYLEFSGENGMSAFFKLDDIKNDYRKFLEICGPTK